MTTPLQQAAQAVLNDWDSSEYPEEAIAELRKALDAEIAQSVEPAAWMTQDGVACIPLYLHPPQQAKQIAVTSGERAELIARLRCLGRLVSYSDVYTKAAEMLEADAQQAKQVAVTSGERAELIAAHQELNMSNYGPDDVDNLNDWANRAYDILAREQQQAKQVPLTDDQIIATFCTTPDFRQYVSAFKAGVKLAEKYHGIGGQP